MKRICCLLLMLAICCGSLLACSNCSGGDNVIKVYGKPNEYCFDACLKANGTVIDRDSVIPMKDGKVKASLTFHNQNAANRIGIQILSDGKPIEFLVNDLAVSYFLIDILKETKFDFAVDGSQLAAGKSRLDIVLVMNESLEMLYSRDDEKNYTFLMSYYVENNSTSAKEESISEYSDPLYYSFDDYYSDCYNGRKQAGSLDAKHDYHLEETAFKNLVSNDELDICFCNKVEDNKPVNMSVVRNTVKNIKSDGKLQLRISGKPGDYWLTMFDNGQSYAGFNGSQTVKVTVKEGCFTYITAEYPQWSNRSGTLVYALAVSCDNQNHRVFDSGLVNVFYAGADIDLGYGYVESTMNLYYQNELINDNITDQIFKYQGGDIEVRFVFNEMSSTYVNSYWMMIMVDGVVQKFSVDDQDELYCYEFDMRNGTVEKILHFTPTVQKSCDEFSVNCIAVPATISNPLTPAAFTNLDSCLTSSIRFTNEGVLDTISEVSHSDESEKDRKIEATDLIVTMAGNAGDDANIDELVTPLDHGLTITITAGRYALSGVSCLIVNGKNVPIDNQAYVQWSVGKRDNTVFSAVVPKDALHYGYNEIFFVSSTGDYNTVTRRLVYVYREVDPMFDVDIIPSEGKVGFDLSSVASDTLVRSFVISTSRNSYFGNFFSCVTARHLSNNSTDDILPEVGDGNELSISPLTIILTTESYDNGVFTFQRYKSMRNVA